MLRIIFRDNCNCWSFDCHTFFCIDPDFEKCQSSKLQHFRLMVLFLRINDLRCSIYDIHGQERL